MAPNPTRSRGCRADVAGLVLALGLSVAGCGGEQVGRSLNVSVSLDLPDSLGLGSPFDIGYTWTPEEGFEPPADDLKVFVHLVDPDGNTVLQDDHFPPQPTSQWRAGAPVSYRHWVYPPPGFHHDYIDFYVGLYQGTEQIATLRDGTLRNRPLVHTVIIRTEDQGGVPVYVEGFHERETSLSGEPELQEWRWMRDRGVVAFGNPRGPATLHLRALSPAVSLDGTQTVTIRIGDRVIGEVEATDTVPYLRRFEVPGDAVGDGDWIEVVLEVDESFVPAQIEPSSTDTRVLGLQVFWMHLGR
jgi:hypothetical protein